MSYDHWKTTPPADDEPPTKEVPCKACGGSGVEAANEDGSILDYCPHCDGCGYVEVCCAGH